MRYDDIGVSLGVPGREKNPVKRAGLPPVPYPRLGAVKGVEGFMDVVAEIEQGVHAARRYAAIGAI